MEKEKRENSGSEPEMQPAIDQLGYVPEKGVEDREMDSFGAAAKTDPAEIKLVRKLDLRIMVNRGTVCNIPVKLICASADSLLNVLPELRGSQRHRAGQVERSGGRSEHV